MSNEEQIADTIEMLYERLNEYNKQDLFNYGYLLESNQILCKNIEEKDKEIERLNNIIDELDNIIRQMIYTGYYVYSKSPYEDFEGQTVTNYMATGEKSEFGRRALVILDKLKELKEGKE